MHRYTRCTLLRFFCNNFFHKKWKNWRLSANIFFRCIKTHADLVNSKISQFVFQNGAPIVRETTLMYVLLIDSVELISPCMELETVQNCEYEMHCYWLVCTSSTHSAVCTLPYTRRVLVFLTHQNWNHNCFLKFNKIENGNNNNNWLLK